MYLGEGEGRTVLEMSGVFLGCPTIRNMLLLSFEHPTLPILRCYHKDIIFGLFHFSVEKQNNQACGYNLTGHVFPLNPGINPTPGLSLTGNSGTGRLPLRALPYVGGRVGQASHLLFCPLFPVFLPIETGSLEVTGRGPGGREPCDFISATRISAVFSINGNLVIFCDCPIYRSLPLHMNLLEQNGFHWKNPVSAW